MKRPLVILLPLLIIALGLAGAWAMYASRPEAKTQIPETPAPLVRVHPVVLEDVQLRVASQGTVTPRTESTLTAEISGRVIEVAPSFESGGFFEKGQTLLRIDPFDYEQAVIRAEAEVAQAELAIAQEEAEAEVARREWESLGEGEAPPLTRRAPQLARARAALQAAEAALSQAKRNLERTTVRAPYAGRVRSKQVDVGQFITANNVLATLYAVDYAEVRLPLADKDLAFLDVPYGYRGEGARRGPRVQLKTQFAGAEHTWEGRIVRTEGEIDPQSRLVHVVARIKNPYGRGKNGERPPLAVGMYVEAAIEGRLFEDIAAIPRAALREGDRVLVVDADNRIRFRQVDVLRTDATTALIRSGLRGGERVCLSNLGAVTDGMKVSLSNAPETGPVRAKEAA